MVPFILGALATAGAIYNNQRNIELAQRQMTFQERMSSTAAQRAVEDYRRAGLNPALAYDRSASTPSGASAQLSDAIGAGIANAQRARELQSSIDLMKAQQGKTEAEKGKTQIEGGTAQIHQDMLDAQKRQQLKLQPFEERLAKANALLAEYMLPGARNQARYDEITGLLSPALGNAKGVADIISRITPARAAKTIIQKAPAVINKISRR